ncbi:MAG: pantetheine-phosphate adenylyltransferase, partial [Flavobacteriaceae bacterium]|nr:pantetheine-phosphate adenylyltransferase [Flavobacteriaceae bacterium]
MNKTAIYPGTFDPITYGHIDVIKKALKLFDKIVVGVSNVSNKNYLFNSEERINIVNKALFNDLKLNKKKISVVSFSSLTTDLCKKYRSNIILRGLRAVSDFEYEFQLAGMNRKLNNNIETIFLMSDVENQIISSRFVKEIIKLNGDIKKFTT